ncbi:MAG: glycosyltransferase family 4 protein [Flaviaesturariibacter sp.]|nr:glycosyltransferase family 4 protein [Flaviaesturariibacter sp.]
MTPTHRSQPKVLSLVWFKIYPALFGGQKGIALFNKYLGKYAQLDCLCASDNAIVDDAGCTILPKLSIGKSQFYKPSNWLELRKWLRRKRYEYVIVEFPYYAMLVWLLKHKSTKFIIHTHNIEAERFKSFGKNGWHLLRWYERWSLKKAHLVLFKTTADKAYALREYGLQASKTYVLPYGVEGLPTINKTAAKKILEQKHGIQPNEKLLFFAGTLDYAPNAEAVNLIIEHIEPLLQQKLPAYKIIICGRNKNHLSFDNNSNIVYVGLVENIHPYFAAADCFISPVRNVHGIQTKILDALNYGLNVICFSKASENFPPYLSPKLFPVAESDYAGFADAIVQSLSATFDTAEAFYEEFGWEVIVKNFVNHLEASA